MGRWLRIVYTPVVEPLSLDEAYLDVTENLQGIASATEIAEQIKVKIRVKTQLTASAGVSYNKFLAKLASDYRKPDGLYVISDGADLCRGAPGDMTRGERSTNTTASSCFRPRASCATHDELDRASSGLAANSMLVERLVIKVPGFSPY
jgi:impB/mucB/samB family